MFTRIILSLLILGSGAVGAGWYFYQSQLSKPLVEEFSYKVENGQSFNSVLNHLQIKIQTSAPVGKVYLKINNKQSSLKPGEYLFEKGMSYKDMIILLTVGQIIEYKVTIPEGYNVFEIADLLEKKEIVLDKNDFLTIALNECESFLEKNIVQQKV